ncbi:hypothetical protein AB4254_09295 [Vibrio breoganii]
MSARHNYKKVILIRLNADKSTELLGIANRSKEAEDYFNEMGGCPNTRLSIDISEWRHLDNRVDFSVQCVNNKIQASIYMRDKHIINTVNHYVDTTEFVTWAKDINTTMLQQRQ